MFLKSHSFKLLVVSLCVFLISGCGKKKEGDAQFKASVKKTESSAVSSTAKNVSDKDLNDTIEQAKSIQLATPFEMAINPIGDRDWFKVALPAQGYLRIQAKDVPDVFTMEVRYAIFDEWADGKEKEIRGWQRLPDACFIPKAGEYYFVLEDDFNDKFSDVPMQIKVDFLKEFDSSEPNNSVAEAAEVHIGEVKKIAIYPKGDMDVFKIKIEKQGYLDLKIKGDLKAITPEVQYFQYDEWAETKEQIVRSWKRLPDACPVAANQEYYIQIRDDFDDNAEETTFDVKFDFIEEMDPYEPNNHYASAKEIKVNDTLQVAIFPEGDNDYFKINTGGSSTLKVMAKDVQESISVEVRFYTKAEDSDTLKVGSDWKRLPAEFDVFAGEEYYMRLRDDFDDKSDPHVFSVKIEGNAPLVKEQESPSPATDESADVAEQKDETGAQVDFEKDAVSDEEAAKAMEERQKLIDARKQKMADMLKKRQEMAAHQAEMRQRQAELKKKRLEAMKAVQSQ